LKIETTRFGIITIEKDKIIEMPDGMAGFPSQKQFVLFQHKDNSPFLWYQSIEDPVLAFVITNPYLFMPEYKIKIKSVIPDSSWKKDSDDDCLEIYVVVNIPNGAPEKMTANLIGPLLINNRKRQAVQVIISDSPYSHKFPLVRLK
jgi:flagellar assembly factor FliW